jgi:hypothetical protein
MLSTIKEMRYKAARSRLRAPLAWLKHRGLNSNDVFLASYERSGSTWLRFVLLEILTHNSAGFDCVNDFIPEMGRHRDVAPLLPGGGRLIKTHEPYRRQYKRAVYLVRDLRDVLLSNWARNDEAGFAVYFAKGKGFDGYLESFLKGKTTHFGSWQNHVRSWLDSPLARNDNLLLVRYEDMRRNTEETLANILEFLGVKADHEAIRRAVANNSLAKMREKEDDSKRNGTAKGLLKMHKSDREDGRFVRSGAVGGWRAKLNDAQVQLIDRYAGSALTRMGYPAGSPSEEEGNRELQPQVKA